MNEKRTTSEERASASRRNGAKSRGPKTPQGKLNSSRNGLRHGILSRSVVLPDCESRKRFFALLESLNAELQPETGIESTLVENMAIARWRQMRLWTMETAGLTHQMRTQRPSASNPAADPAIEYDSPTRAALAFRALSDQSRSLELMNRYETRFERQYARALDRFLDFRARRKPPQNAFLPNEPENLLITDRDRENEVSE